MLVGVPTETKNEEYRVAITPAMAAALVHQGHRVIVQSGAGKGSAIEDDELKESGAEIVPDRVEIFKNSELILKVKEPQLDEVTRLQPGQMLFTFLHLAAYPKISQALVKSGAIAIAYETVQLASGELPMLSPMSEIAGRMAVQTGANLMERTHGGRGILIGGTTDVPPAQVTIIGAGNAGRHAAIVAAGMGANVNILDINPAPLEKIDELRLKQVTTIRSSRETIDSLMPKTDLLIGAVLITGARAPVIISADHIKSMRPGSVVIDIAIDQGGCIETARETTHADPTYVVDGVTHFAVGNIPGAVPHTSTYALTKATMPYVSALTDGIETALKRFPELIGGVNISGGNVTNRSVAESLGMPYTEALTALGLK
ncbi:MAG TPA: alanine dehydrogenase [Gemmatimonadetes bacterium]|nr:alanine dehydrogenase [Gemmatimonadota bacterium]